MTLRFFVVLLFLQSLILAGLIYNNWGMVVFGAIFLAITVQSRKGSKLLANTHQEFLIEFLETTLEAVQVQQAD